MASIIEFPHRDSPAGSMLDQDTARAPYPADKERRHPPIRCAGCNAWNQTSLVFMSNGADYCLSCARRLTDRMGYGFRPAGRRWDDIRAL